MTSPSVWGPIVRALMPAQSNNTNEQNKAADEVARTARTVANEAGRVGEQTARVGADVFRRGTETARDNLQSGVNMATQSFQRIDDQFDASASRSILDRVGRSGVARNAL